MKCRKSGIFDNDDGDGDVCMYVFIVGINGL